jgi:hypothetical protein
MVLIAKCAVSGMVAKASVRNMMMYTRHRSCGGPNHAVFSFRTKWL